MANSIRIRRGAAAGLPTLADGEPGFTTDTYLLYVGQGGVNRLINGTGTVTSVGLSMPSIFSVSGSPVTASGTLTAALATQVANTIFAGPSSGADAAPTFRALVADDVPNLAASKITTGTLATARGGTGLDASAASNGQLLIGNGSGLTLAALTAGSGVSITNGAGSISISGTGGTVTSVALSLPGIFSVSGSPVTGSGTLTATLATQSANTIFAGPTSGGAAAPTFRAQVVADLPAYTGHTAADVALDDELPGYDTSAAANRKFAIQRVGGILPAPPGGRLTATSGVPVTTGDVGGATTLYYTPYLHNRIDLWDGTRWVTVTFSETSMALGTMTSGGVYDVFAYLSSGALALEKLAWSSATARATEATLQDGRYCKSGDKTRLYLGTFRAATASVCEDSNANRGLWNNYNRRPRALVRREDTASWTWTTTSFHQVNASSANQVTATVGLVEDLMWLEANSYGLNSGAAVVLGVGIGVDSTSTNSATVYGGIAPLASQGNMVRAVYCSPVSLGYHYFAWIEKSGTGSGTTTWYGTGVTDIRTGLVGIIWG